VKRLAVDIWRGLRWVIRWALLPAIAVAWLTASTGPTVLVLK
jgi:hypothetical protein